MSKEVIIVGGFHEVIELCEEIGYNIVGIIDNNITGVYWGYEVIGTDNDAENIYMRFKDVPLIITPDLPIIRKRLFNLYSGIGYKFETVISPSSKLSRSSSIGTGVVIQHNVNISANAKIGDFVKLNTGCNIMHDSSLGNFVTIAPGGVILGKISIGDNVYVGANSTILPGRTIGSDVVIGAGAVVTKDVESNSKIKGIPAKRYDK